MVMAKITTTESIRTSKGSMNLIQTVSQQKRMMSLGSVR